MADSSVINEVLEESTVDASVRTNQDSDRRLRSKVRHRSAIQTSKTSRGKTYTTLENHCSSDSGSDRRDDFELDNSRESKAQEAAYHAASDLISYHDLPEWAKDNEFIQRHYRPITQSWSYLTCSIFRLHNETFNIWSHLVPSLACLAGAAYYSTIPSTAFDNALVERSVFTLFLVCATVMLSCSWFFHAYYQHSYGVFCWTSKLDYTGIAFMIVGSFIPWVYYVFYCEPTIQLTYITSITVLGVACMLVSCLDRFAQPAYRPVRAGLFAALGLSAAVPATHAVFLYSLRTLFTDFYLGSLLLMAFLYLFGAFLFATRFPECKWPGKFDLIFCSHNLFHICVVVAAVVHFIAIRNLQIDRKALGNNCPTP